MWQGIMDTSSRYMYSQGHINITSVPGETTKFSSRSILSSTMSGWQYFGIYHRAIKNDDNTYPNEAGDNYMYVYDSLSDTGIPTSHTPSSTQHYTEYH